MRYSDTNNRSLKFPLMLGLAALLALAPRASVRAQQPTSDSFSLEPGDVVQVEVWREKDLSGSFNVDEHGRLTLPMLGIVDVRERPWDGLRDSLIEAYQTQLKNPSVTLTPLRRVQVLGAVNRPGQYLADPTLSLAGLIALAGGATPDGDLHRVRVVRNGQTIVKSGSVESLLLKAGVHSNDQIFVDRHSWLERNATFVASALISTAGIIITIIHP